MQSTTFRSIRIASIGLALLLDGDTGFALERYPLEPADTSSPRATLSSFVDACNKVYTISRRETRDEIAEREHAHIADRLLRCLDLSQEPEYLREYSGREAAVCIKEILDRVDKSVFENVPDADAVQEDEITRWAVPHTDVWITMVKEGPRQGEFLFRPETVSRATEFYYRIERWPYRTDGGPAVSPGFYEWFLSEPGSAWVAAIVDVLPAWMSRRVYGQAVWQWTGLLVVNVLGLVAMFVAYRVGRRGAQAILGTSVLGYCFTLLLPMAAMLIPLMVRNLIAEDIRVSGTALSVTKFSTNVVFLLAVLVVLVSAGNRVAELIISSPRIHPKGLDAQLIRIVSRVLSLAAAVIVFLEGGQYLGIPLTTLLAGAGVGGLALALAAQDTLKNLFGSMMIILDKPYRAGERIVVKNYDGVVEEIGLRSTKIRLLTGHMATIPNEEMARSDIENVGRRRHIRRVADIPIPLDTPPEKIEKAVSIIRDILADHEGMDAQFPPRVYQNEFNRDSLNIRVIYWYQPPDYWEFLALSQRVNKQILERFRAEGIRLALPATTTFMAQRDEHPLELKVTGDK